MRGRTLVTVAAMGVVAGLALSLPSMPPAHADQGLPVVVDTVTAPKPNSLFTVDPRMSPQLGQSFTLDHPVLASSVRLHPYQYALAKKLEYLSAGYRAEHFTYVDDGAVGVTTLLNIWKSNSGDPLPVNPEPGNGGFDVAAGGFTNVYSKSYTVPFDLSKPFTLPLEPELTLDPGVYLVAWYFVPDNRLTFNLRFSGEVSGHSQGQWYGRTWVPSVCRYAPLPDSSPPGSAAYAADQWASPYGMAPSGPPPGTIGYLTWFRAIPSKTLICVNPAFAGYNKKGVPIDKKGRILKNPYDPKWMPMNTGDLDMEITGRNL